MIIQMSSERVVDRPMRAMPRDIKWSRGLRVTVALASATASWVAVVGAGYLILQIF